MWGSFTRKYFKRKHRAEQRRRLIEAKLRRLPRLRWYRAPAELRKSGPGFGISTTPEVIPARVLLSDTVGDTLRLFSRKEIKANQEISLTIDGPNQFFAQGRVNWCAHTMSSGRVISAEPFNYRMEIEFTSLSEEDRLKVQNYFRQFR